MVAKRSSDALLHWSEKFADGRRANGALETAAQKHTIYRLPFSRRLVRTHAANCVIVRIEVRQINLQALEKRSIVKNRSAETRVGIERVRPCRYWLPPFHKHNTPEQLLTN